MNRIILLVLFVFSYCVGTSQAITQRSTTAVTVQDARLFAQYNFRPPVFSDTVQANLQIGLDSCGALIFARNINAYYYRACSPKRWVAITSGGGSGNSWNIGGNASPSSPDIGTTTVSELDIITNGIARAKILSSGINRSAAARNKYLMIDTSTRYLYYGDAGTTIDTTSLSNRINLKIDSLKRSNDSVFAYRNGVRVFQYKDSVGGGGVSDTVYTQSPIMSITRNDSNIIFFNADTANVWRGGGGGVGGSGTQYFVPKWSATTTLQNSQIFDSVNVGINTTSPAYKLDVKGTTRIKAERSGELFLIEDSLGNDRIKVSNDSTFITGGTIPLTIIGSGGIQARIGNSTFETPQRIYRLNTGAMEFYNNNNDGIGFDFNYNNQPQSTSTNSAMINLGGIYKNQQSFAFSNLLISPTYNFDSTNVTSSAIARGIYYNPTIPLNGLRSAKHIAFQSNSGNVVMKGLKTSSSTTDSIAIWINDTLSKAPYPSGGGVAVDTIFRTLGKDSIFYKKNGNTYAIKDSVGTNPPASGYYGAFQDTTTQTAASINTAYAVKLNTTDLTNGVSVVNNISANPTIVKIANAGIYNIQFSLQLQKTGGSGNMIADIWLRKNGVNLDGTTGKVVLTGSANASPVVAAWNYVIAISSGDSLELMWATSNTNVEIVAAVATAPHPSIPSAILTVTQQSGIMAGTGISPLDTANMLLPYLRKIDTVSLSNRINLKLNIADTTLFQRKSLSANTIMANNTSATANATAQAFRDTSGVYPSGSINWTGTTAPSGATNHSFRLTQVGKCVTVHIALVYATNGSALTTIQLLLPPGAPTPAQPTGLTGSIFNMYPVYGQLVSSANQSILSVAARGFLRNNTAATGYEIFLIFSSTAPGQLGVTLQYWTN